MAARFATACALRRGDNGGSDAGLAATRWCAVQCQPACETKAAVHLANQNFRIFLPRHKRTRRHARRIETVLRPFFPGYLFLELDLSHDPWRSIGGTIGVTRLVMQGERPAYAPIGLIEALKAACDDEGVVDYRPPLRLGEAVRILAGALTDQVGELIRLDDHDRVRVLLNILGAKVPVQLPRDCVVPARSVL